MRGTQILRLAAGTELGLGPAHTVIAPAPGRDQPVTVLAPMLSIGLRPPGPAPTLTDVVARAELHGDAGAFPLDASVVSLGRNPPATIVLDDARVSSRHAEIVHHEGARYLRDAGSRNGTWINGERVTVPRRLAHGDRLRVGGSELVFALLPASPAREIPGAP